jgi:hypothetical protein
MVTNLRIDIDTNGRPIQVRSPVVYTDLAQAVKEFLRQPELRQIHARSAVPGPMQLWSLPKGRDDMPVRPVSARVLPLWPYVFISIPGLTQ